MIGCRVLSSVERRNDTPRGVFNNTSTVTTGVTPGKRVPSLTVLVHFYPHLTGDARFSRLTHASDICNPSLGVVLHVYPCLATLGLLVLLSLVISSLFNKRFSAIKFETAIGKSGLNRRVSLNDMTWRPTNPVIRQFPPRGGLRLDTYLHSLVVRIKQAT